MGENRVLTSVDDIEEVRIETDILIIGGGTAGCLAAVEAKEKDPNVKVLIMEKAHIDRSGCLAAGMDAINVVLKKDETPESYVKWSRWQAGGILREDLALSMAKEINAAVEKVEKAGLPIWRDENGEFITRGRFDVHIYGESMKPIIAEMAKRAGAEVINRVMATNYLVKDGKVVGAIGFGVRDGKLYVVKAKATIIATGGAAGLYRPYTVDGIDSHHQVWYSPFNTGAGYAMGIRAGAEMTSFEQRWAALRTKDYNGPIDTISVGYKTPIINAKGERILQTKFADSGGDTAPRYIRNYAVMKEWYDGNPPTYVSTTHITDDQLRELKTDYLNERPTFVLFMASRGINPQEEPIEVYGSDPYIVGGHCMAGYWVDENRKTTLDGLYAAGDVAGGVPNKFIGGCWVEGMMAARDAVEYIKTVGDIEIDEEQVKAEKSRVFAPLIRYFQLKDEYTTGVKAGVTAKEMEERLQRLMDEYAGGVGQFYRMNEERLLYALKHLKVLKEQTKYLYAKDLHDLLKCHEVIDLLDVAEVVVHHCLYRKETRWPAWHERIDYPEKDDENWLCFVNSVRDPETGEIRVFKRPYEQIVPGDRYSPN
jgi:adenylylsulfate reductase subunit A